MEYKTILTGLFERLSGFREKRPHAGRKYELLGIISDMGNVIWQLKNDVLQRVMQEAPVDVDVDIDYTEMANRVLQLELPERPSDWEDYEATSDSSDGLWLEDRMDDEAVDISIRVISDVNRLSMTQLARVANETLSKLNSVMVQIVEGLARRHSNEEYVRLYESEKRRYLKSRTASRAKQKYDEWLDICFGEPTLENIDDYRLEKLLHMFEQGGVQAKADHVQRATHYSGEFDFTQIDDDVKRKLAYKHYAALRQMTDWQNGCLVVIPSLIGQFFFVSRHDENAKGRRNVLLKYLHKIDMAQEELRKRLAEQKENRDSFATQPDILSTMDEALLSDEARHYWEQLEEKEFVDSYWKLTPKTTRKQAMYIAEAFSNKVGMKSKWKPFETHWDMKNLAQEKWEMQQTGGLPSRYQEIDEIFEE